MEHRFLTVEEDKVAPLPFRPDEMSPMENLKAILRPTSKNLFWTKVDEAHGDIPKMNRLQILEMGLLFTFWDEGSNGTSGRREDNVNGLGDTKWHN